MHTASFNYTKYIFNSSVAAGANPKKLIEALDQGADPFQDVSKRFPCHNVLTMLRQAELDCNDEQLGFLIGKNLRPLNFNDTGYATLFCKTLKQALELNEKFQQLTQQFVTTKLELDDEFGCVYVHENFDDPELTRGVTLLAMTCYVSVGRWLLWHKEEVLSVSFKHKKTKNYQLLEQFFGCKIKYEQENNFFKYKSSAFHKPLSMSNPYLLNELEIKLENELRKLKNGYTLKNRLDYHIDNIIHLGEPTLKDIASLIEMNENDIREQLSEENTSFKKIILSCRMEKAQLYMKEDKKSLKEIAEILGYSEYSSFSRAYKQFFNSSPKSDLTTFRAKKQQLMQKKPQS